MLVVRATKKLLQLVHRPAAEPEAEADTLLGCWYATVLFWRPRVVLLVNESTLVPALMPLAPVATLPGRIRDEILAVLAAHDAPQPIIDVERQRMGDCCFGKTANRSVVGVMNEFAFLAKVHGDSEPQLSLRDLSLRLADVPCSPLYRRHVKPRHELAATLATITP